MYHSLPLAAILHDTQTSLTDCNHEFLSVTTLTVPPFASSWAVFHFPPLSWNSGERTANKRKSCTYLTAAPFPTDRSGFWCKDPHELLSLCYQPLSHLTSALIFLQSQVSSRPYLQCLHNTPLISMGTSPGKAGWQCRSTSM